MTRRRLLRLALAVAPASAVCAPATEPSEVRFLYDDEAL
jgi:hypothetical protein